MPVIDSRTPQVQINLPVPTPAQTKKQAPPPPAPQPIPQNPQSGLQTVPQEMAQPEQPEPRAIILPWSPPQQKRMSRKYAADDDLNMDFDSMNEEELPREVAPRPQPQENIQGRTRKQILKQMLDAAKKGIYDPAGMTPSDYIKDMENKEPAPEEMQNIIYDPEEDEQGGTTKLSRYAKGVKRYSLPKMPEGVSIKPSQGDGYRIDTKHGYIDYRPVDGINEIWWVESHKKGHGSQLVDLMQSAHPASGIAWGVTTPSGKVLRDKWHAAHPSIEKYIGPLEGQFDPSGDNYGEEDDDEDDDYNEEEE